MVVARAQEEWAQADTGEDRGGQGTGVGMREAVRRAVLEAEGEKGKGMEHIAYLWGRRVYMLFPVLERQKKPL